MCKTQLFISTLINNPSPHTQLQEGGNDITIVRVFHTSCEWVHCFLDSEAIVSEF